MMKAMNDLPKADPAGAPGQSNPSSMPTGVSPAGNKEIVGGSDRPEGLIDATGQEMDLPREVVSAGVRIQPTQVSIPPPVAQMGVQPAGNNVSTPAQQVSLPLTDDQIVKGLHLGIVNSVRWLAEWCVKRLKQLHKAVAGGGKNIRVKV